MPWKTVLQKSIFSSIGICCCWSGFTSVHRSGTDKPSHRYRDGEGCHSCHVCPANSRLYLFRYKTTLRFCIFCSLINPIFQNPTGTATKKTIKKSIGSENMAADDRFSPDSSAVRVSLRVHANSFTLAPFYLIFLDSNSIHPNGVAIRMLLSSHVWFYEKRWWSLEKVLDY